MSVITEGFHIQLVNRMTSRIIFSAATDELTQDAFDQLWKSVGGLVFKGLINTQKDQRGIGEYELRITPLS